MADRRRQRASQDTEDEESGASGSDSGGSPARGGGGCSGSTGGGGSGSLPSQRGGRAGALHLRRVESGGAKSAEESECVSARGRGGRLAGRGRGVVMLEAELVVHAEAPCVGVEGGCPRAVCTGAPRGGEGRGGVGGFCRAAAEGQRIVYSETGLEAKGPDLPEMPLVTDVPFLLCPLNRLVLSLQLSTLWKSRTNP